MHNTDIKVHIACNIIFYSNIERRKSKNRSKTETRKLQLTNYIKPNTLFLKTERETKLCNAKDYT